MFLVHDVSLDGTPVSCRNDLRLSSRATSSTLSLYANQLTGPFVDGFGALTRLVNLNLANNALVGSFPSCIPLMTALTYEVPRSANVTRHVTSGWRGVVVPLFLRARVQPASSSCWHAF